MSSTEAAASLFDSADSSLSDPFATLGTEHNQEPSGNLSTGPNIDQSAQSDAANFFDNLTEQQLSPNVSAEVKYNQAAPQGYDYTQVPYTPVHASVPSEAHNGYQAHQQWGGNQSYFGPSVQSNTSYDANINVPSAAHDPYAPPQASTYTPSASHSTTSLSENQPSAYDTRKADLYMPPQPLDQYAHSPHDNYTQPWGVKSVATAHQPHYALHQVVPPSSLPPPPKTDLATVPPPPAPTSAQVTRPKVSNAYDPPFPVKSYSRRNVSGPAKYAPSPAQAAYTAYHATTPPPLIHPPRAPSVPSTSAPLPLPPSTYVPPTTQPPFPSQNRWTNGSHTGSSYVPYRASPPPPSHFSTSAESRSHWAHPQEGQEHPETARAIPESLPFKVQGLQEPVSKISDEIGRQDGHTVTDFAVEQPFDAPVPIDSTIANSLSAQPQSPNLSIKSSPRKSLKTLSPPPRMSQDLRRASSPRLPSSSSPVYGLSQPSRASPDLRKELIRSDHAPRARTTSPGADGTQNTVNPYAPPSRGPALRSKSTSVTSIDGISFPESSPSAAQNRYAPQGTKISNVYGIERSGSPNSLSARSSDGWQSAKLHPSPNLPRVAETSQNVTPLAAEPVHTLVEEDLYAPFQHARPVKPSPSLGGYGQSPYNYSADISPPEGIAIKPAIAPYAPSPSLLGANDPLGRTSVRVPVISFGFGGRLITCFHDTGSLNTGFDVALSSRTSTKIQVQSWKSLVPESALDSETAFPSPLHGDPGPPSTSIMKVTAITQAKAKKAQLLKYLSDRVDEITRGLGYLHSSSTEKRTVEGKLVLVKLLRIMVENDGRLSGTPEIDSAVRAALVPRLEGLLSTNDSGGTFTTTADAAASYGSLSSAGDGAPISVTTLRAAALDKIEEFLLRGERRQAYHYALDEKLWAHAMIIASSIDKEAWKEVVNEFIRVDLGTKGDSAFALTGLTDAHSPSVNGREGLRVAYSLFSGQGAGAVQELTPKNILTRPNGRLPLPATAIPAAVGQVTPRTPNFALPTAGVKIPPESLSKWAETVAMMIMSPMTPDASAALTAFGDQLMANGWLEAAHVCYLLSPQTSPVGGIGNPAVRVVLLGGKSPAALPVFSRDPDSIIFTETLEYALASAPVSKGQEPNHGIPHLQAYRLIRAYAAAEAGELGIASRYCEAITASLVRGSVYFTPTMLEQLKGLADRLSGVSHSDKNNSWMAGKISKPSLDTIGGWLEGRFTKLVTGESDSPASPKEDNGVKADGVHGFTGPFAHYNTISSTTSSARSSPAPTFLTPAYAMPPPPTLPKTGSLTSNKVPPYGHGHGYGMEASLRKKQSPAPGPLQATTSYPMVQTQPGNYQSNGYTDPGSDLQTPKPAQHEDEGGNEAGNENRNVQEVTWWGSSYSSGGDQGNTPTGARFEKVDDVQGSMDNNGFFSPMMNDSFTIGLQSSTPSTAVPSRQTLTYEDDDDLGLGNSSRGKKESGGSEGAGGSEGGSGQEAKRAAASAAPAKEQEKKADTLTNSEQSSGGWFSRWWGRKENTSGGPVKASLGEESSFYYDKELKRWVNKRAGAEAQEATPSPPPPRAQTASPGMMAGPKPPAGTSGPPAASTTNGNARPASAIDLTASPPTSKQPPPGMRARSGLAPPGLDSAPPTPTASRNASPGNGGGPPPSRPKSQASQKRNVRSRYVDVFAQEGAGAGGGT